MTYRVDSQNRMTWVPPGWKQTPPHVLGPPETAEELALRAREHERRVSNYKTSLPGDWPAFLLAFHPRRPLPWRLVKCTPTKRLVSWHATRQQALDEGRRV